MILGIDEVGRGSWAGPLVVGAVVLGDATIEGLTDSKKLTAIKREKLDILIREKAVSVGVGWVHSDELDKIGLSSALVEATKRAVSQINVPYHEIIIDGTVNFLADTQKGKYVTLLKKADLLIGSVSAASIVAKVARDKYMDDISSQYPMYKFESNVGYGTKVHDLAIKEYGITIEHRKSFAPIKNHTKIAPSVNKSTTSIGLEAQDLVVNYLISKGHQVVECNYKTRYSEIDIITKLKSNYYFTEVKYRRNHHFGSGLEAINIDKFDRMKSAALGYASKRNIDDYVLAVAAVSSKPMKLDEFLEL